MTDLLKQGLGLYLMLALVSFSAGASDLDQNTNGSVAGAEGQGNGNSGCHRILVVSTIRDSNVEFLLLGNKFLNELPQLLRLKMNSPFPADFKGFGVLMVPDVAQSRAALILSEVALIFNSLLERGPRGPEPKLVISAETIERNARPISDEYFVSRIAQQVAMDPLDALVCWHTLLDRLIAGGIALPGIAAVRSEAVVELRQQPYQGQFKMYLSDKSID